MLVDLIKAVPKWLVVVAFFVLVILMVISISFGKFSIANYEFGFGPKGVTNAPTTYLLTGEVEKEDRESPADIMISPQFPTVNATGAGKIFLKVWKDPEGKFPMVAFLNGGYQVEAVDLNDKAAVEEAAGELKIKKTIVLKAIPQQ